MKCYCYICEKCICIYNFLEQRKAEYFCPLHTSYLIEHPLRDKDNSFCTKSIHFLCNYSHSKLVQKVLFYKGITLHRILAAIKYSNQSFYF